jgi:tetratricopeptide (TPR) repeat protein
MVRCGIHKRGLLCRWVLIGCVLMGWGWMANAQMGVQKEAAQGGEAAVRAHTPPPPHLVRVIDSLERVRAAGRPDTATVRALQLLSVYKDRYDSRTALVHARECIALADYIDFPVGKARGYVETSRAFKSMAQYDSALHYMRLAGLTAHAAGASRILAIAHLEAGDIYELQDDLVQAARHTLRAKELAEMLGEKEIAMGGMFNLGAIYFKMEDYAQALALFEEVDRIHRDNANDQQRSGLLENMGNAHLKLGHMDKALELYTEAVRMGEAAHDDKGLTYRYTNLGSLYFFQKDYPKAIQTYARSLALCQKIGDRRREATIHNNLGNCYRFMGDYKQALFHSEKAIAIADEIGVKESKMRSFSNLAETYAMLGDAQKALQYQREHVALRDSIKGNAVEAELAALRVQAETEKKEHHISMLQEQKQLAEAKSENKTIWLVIAGFFVLTLLLLMLVLVLLLINRRRRQQAALERQEMEFARKRLELEQRALRAQMNPHFIFNSLNAIQRLYIEGDLDRAGDYMSDFAQILRKILDHSGNETISLAAELETLRLYLRLEEARLDGVLEHEILVDAEIDIHNTHLPPLVLQPFVENAIWHGILPSGGRGKVEICLAAPERDAEASHIVCTIRDNGIGIETSRKGKKTLVTTHESKGIRITRERLGTAGTVVAEELPNGGGTKITLEIPVIYK